MDGESIRVIWFCGRDFAVKSNFWFLLILIRFIIKIRIKKEYINTFNFKVLLFYFIFFTFQMIYPYHVQLCSCYKFAFIGVSRLYRKSHWNAYQLIHRRIYDYEEESTLTERYCGWGLTDRSLPLLNWWWCEAKRTYWWNITSEFL